MTQRLLLLAVATFVGRLTAAEIHIQHSVIRTMLARQVFTDDGRKYVRADRAATCSYAYLENPEIGAANGQLRIRARFTGHSGTTWFGRCLGLGDSFTAVIYATPYYKGGFLLLKDVRVDSEGADGYYIRRVRAALADGLPRQFSYNLYNETKRIFEERQASDLFSKELSGFSVQQVRVTDTDIVLVLDFVLRVR